MASITSGTQYSGVYATMPKTLWGNPYSTSIRNKKELPLCLNCKKVEATLMICFFDKMLNMDISVDSNTLQSKTRIEMIGDIKENVLLPNCFCSVKCADEYNTLNNI